MPSGGWRRLLSLILVGGLVNFTVYYHGRTKRSALLHSSASLDGGYDGLSHGGSTRGPMLMEKEAKEEAAMRGVGAVGVRHERKEEKAEDVEEDEEEDRLRDQEVVEGGRPAAEAEAVGAEKKRPKNILYLMTDDLRPQLSPYGRPVITPNFDRLASMSTTFERAYTQDPICNPSRASLLTGRRPDTTQVWLFEANPPQSDKKLYQVLKEAGGYALYGSGKLEHWISTGMNHFDSYFPASTQEWNRLSDENYGVMKSSVQPDDEWPIEAYLDSKVAAQGIEYLEKAAEEARNGGRPFFVGVGFHQPHRPWHFPRQFWDLYNDTFVPITPQNNPPIDAPSIFVGDINPNPIGMIPENHKLYHVDLDKKDNVPYEALREQMRGYHASISFLDYQIGRLLDAFDRLQLGDDTAIVFCVDHGLNVGDHGLWDKRTLMETTARVPLFIRDPTQPTTFGRRVSSIVENVDIFPTLLDMVGLKEEQEQQLWPPLEGESLMPLLRSSASTRATPFAVTQIARCCDRCKDQDDVREVSWRNWHVCRGGHHEWAAKNDKVLMGYSARTDSWRYNMWLDFNSTTLLPEWNGGVIVEELYDHRDPRCNVVGNFDLCEGVNVESDPTLSNVKKDLMERLTSFIETRNRPYWTKVLAGRGGEGAAPSREGTN